MRHTAHIRGTSRGFTLIELMITLAVVAILAVIAVPSYQDSVRKSRRADAAAGLVRLQQLQERHRGNFPAYASAVASMPGSAASPEGHYTLAVDAANATSYTMTATADAASPQFADTRCRRLRVTMNAGTIGYTSFDAGGIEDTTNVNRCWAR